MVYIGQSRGAKMIARLTELGFGEMTVRGELEPRRTPWAFDNGAFRDWKKGVPFDAVRFSRDVARIREMESRPDFVVVPDVVAGGVESLDVSLGWLDELAGVAPLYLAVQDGMGIHHWHAYADRFDGIFVGGTVPWKIRTGEGWVKAAHSTGKPCHVGRVGTGKRVRWARRIGVDSIDSCLPLFAERNLRNFLNGLNDPQEELF